MTRVPLEPHVLRDLIAKCGADVSAAITRTSTLAELPDDLMSIAVSGGFVGSAAPVISALHVIYGAEREVAEKVAGAILVAQGLMMLGRPPARVTAQIDRVIRRLAGDEFADRLKLEFV